MPLARYAFAYLVADEIYKSVSALRAHRGAGIYVRVLSTTFARGEYIAISHREIISHLRSKYIALVCEHSSQTSISRERSELK